MNEMIKKNKWIILGAVGVIAFLWWKKNKSKTSSVTAPIKDVAKSVETAVEEVADEVSDEA